ncbi:MAG TPA: hypothetical protein VHH15_00755, partial [Actinophytocola sp.]|nr:hypothetical protein [Actinophytocola sp.]
MPGGAPSSSRAGTTSSRSAPLGVLFALRELVLPALAELGAPPGTLNFFCARPGPVLRAWLDSPDVHDVF